MSTRKRVTLPFILLALCLLGTLAWGQAPTFTRFTPVTGGVGTAVTLTGTNFTGVTGIKFNGTTAPFTINNSTTITATVPTGAATGKISIIAAAGTVISSSSFTVIPAPTITSFTPTSGLIGTLVTVTGSNFTVSTTVKCNGTNEAATTNTLLVLIGPGTTTGPLTVSTAGGTATSTSVFTVLVPPVFTSFTPTSGPVGTVVTLTGSNFTGTTAVTFNGVAAAAFTVVNSTTITAKVATGTTTGKISITTPAGTVTSASSFTVTSPPAPTITSFSPNSGFVGQNVSITGTNFTLVSSVTFNGSTATNYQVASSTHLTATVPTGATTGKIAVTNPGGTGISTTLFTVNIPQAPTITSFTPIAGAVGYPVMITGTNFIGVSAVKFNGTAVPAYSIMVSSTTGIYTYVPLGATTGKISVTASGGTVTSTGVFTVTQLPTITSFTPTSGPNGQVVQITGTNFTGATSVVFHDTPATTYAVNSATSITATVGIGTTTGYIFITTPISTAMSLSPFTVPNSINPIDGGEKVWVASGNFTMGSTSSDQYAQSNEEPQHTVYLDGYWIYKYPVTVAQYQAFCTATSRAMPAPPTGIGWNSWNGYGNYPMTCINWNDATAYATWAGAKLPTEAQREKAARGTDGRRWPWGNTWDATKCANYANSGGPFVTPQTNHFGPWQIGSFLAGASPYGAQDMAGNVSEWCADWYGETYYQTSPANNPTGPTTGTLRVMRGGSWIGYASQPEGFRTAARSALVPTTLSNTYYGFRCVMPQPAP